MADPRPAAAQSGGAAPAQTAAPPDSGPVRNAGPDSLPAAHLFEAEYSLMELVWRHAPVGSTRLVALAAEQLGWKKSATYTVLRKLAGRGVLANENATVRPLITRQQALRAQAAPMLARCGGLSGFLTAFFEGATLSQAEADQLQALIDASRARREPSDPPDGTPGKEG